MTKNIAIIVWFISIAICGCKHGVVDFPNKGNKRINDCASNWEFFEFRGLKKIKILLASKAWKSHLISYPSQVIGVTGSDTIAILYENIDWSPQIGDFVTIKTVTWRKGLEGVLKLPTTVEYQDEKLNDLYCSVKYGLYADLVELNP